MSPIDERAVEPEPLAERPPELAGRIVALLDIGKNRGAEFLDRLDELLRSRGAKTFRVSKPTFAKPAPAEVIEQVALHGDLAVEALAD